jgi:hypothetical protein
VDEAVSAYPKYHYLMKKRRQIKWEVLFHKWVGLAKWVAEEKPLMASKSKYFYFSGMILTN